MQFLNISRTSNYAQQIYIVLKNIAKNIINFEKIYRFCKQYIKKVESIENTFSQNLSIKYKNNIKYNLSINEIYLNCFVSHEFDNNNRCKFFERSREASPKHLTKLY